MPIKLVLSCVNKLCVLDLLLLHKLKDEYVRDKPVYLNPFTFAFPITAIVSILHRVSGVILFFIIPLFLSILASVLYSPFTISPTCKILTWVFLSALVYHLLAGIRHLVMDIGYAETKEYARISSFAIIFATIMCSLLIGYRLC